MGDRSEVFMNDRRVSLMNMRRLDSTIDPEAAEKARRGMAPQHVSYSAPPPSEFQTLKARQMDTTFKEIEIDGWRSLIRASSTPSRAFWLAISILCLGILVYEVRAVFVNYFTRPLSTSYLILTNESMIFPDIYICPMNSINWTTIDHDKSLLTYAFYMKQISGIKDYQGSVGKASANAKAFNYTIFEMKEKFMQFGYDLDEFMPACSFTQSFTNYLQCSDVTEERIDAVYGKCFLLSMGPNRTQTTPNRGLTITFNLHKELYPTLPLFAPTTEGVALYVGDEVMFLRPGSHYQIEIRAESLKFINVHRGNVHHHCVGNGEHLMKFSVINRDEESYNQRDCNIDCYVREIWDICNCLPILDPARVKPHFTNGSIHVPLCDASRYTKCVHPLVDNNPDVRARVEHCKSRCYVPCQFTRYQMKLSDAPLHALGYKYLLDYYNTTIDNIIDVALAYPALDYTEFKQDLSKSFDELISDLGGQIGLWLGASMVTIIQLPFVLATMCMYKSFRRAGAVKGVVAKKARRFTQPNV